MLTSRAFVLEICLLNYPNYVCVAIGQAGGCHIGDVSRRAVQVPVGAAVTWICGTSEPVTEARLAALRDVMGGVARSTASHIEGASTLAIDGVTGVTSGFAQAVSAHQSLAGPVGDTSWRSFLRCIVLVKLDPDDRRVALSQGSEAVGALFAKETSGKRGFLVRALDVIVRLGAQARMRRQMKRVFALADEMSRMLTPVLDPSERSAAMHRLGADVATALAAKLITLSGSPAPGAGSRAS